MDFIKAQIDGEFQTLGFKNQRRNLKPLPQTGSTSVKRDRKREALMPGKRKSKTGKIYWETRKNRSDAKGSKV